MAKYQIPNFALKSIENIAQNEGFTKYSISSSAGSNHGDGFLGYVLRITIKGDRNEKFNDELSLILKLPPNNQSRREQFIAKDLFQQEIFTYTEIFPKISQFQNDHQIPAEFRFSEYPKCSGVIEDYDNQNFDLEHVELVLKAQAKLHGLTFILRHQKPEIFHTFAKMDDKIAKLMSSKEMVEMKNKIFDEAILGLRANEINAIRKFKDVKEKFNEYIAECVDYKNAEPFVVVNHGDSWTNNIMFSYKDNGDLDDLCLIDFQMTRAASPVLDFLYFVFSATEKSFRDRHYNRIMHTYYNTLSDTIRSTGNDPDQIFSWNNFQDHLHKFGKFALLVPVLLLKTITANLSDIPDMEEYAENVTNDGKSLDLDFTGSKFLDKYFNRVGDLIRDIVNLEYV